MTLTFTSVSGTPNTDIGTTGLNTYIDSDTGDVGFCGFTDWATGVTKDLSTCFLGADPPVSFKESWVVDDSAAQLKWYTSDDDTVVDTAGYPTVIESDDPNLK